MERTQRPDAPQDHAAMADAICRAITSNARDHAVLGECAALAERLGFDGFSYIVVRPGSVGTELVHHWTTASARWKTQYRAHAFHLVDPRILLTHGRCVPVTWAADPEAADPRARAFHTAAGAHFIRSGVAMSVQESHGLRGVVTWDIGGVRHTLSHAERARTELATLSLLTGFVHEAMRGLAGPDRHGPASSPLTPRERECLTLAAHGMTSADIGIKLAIAERTANFHIANIIDKLGALNRGEAIARGVALNLVSLP